MGKKKFIDKKRSATFHLLARDTATLPAAGESPLTDRIFVRVDNNPFSVPGFTGDEEPAEDDSIFADAPETAADAGEGGYPPPWIAAAAAASASDRTRGLLSDNVRKEILELGFPDDGYNYLLHLREIRNSGGGSSYYQNSKAKLDQVPLDVKAYDASKLRISSEVSDDVGGDSMYTVSSKSFGVKPQRVIDLDVVKLLDDSDLSRFGSDVDDLEEDFVVQANLVEGVEKEEEEEDKLQNVEAAVFEGDEENVDAIGEQDNEFDEVVGDDEMGDDEKPRVRRLLDEQFDLLALQEYDTDSDSDDAACIDTNRELLASKLKDALKNYDIDDLEIEEKYTVHGDSVRVQGSSTAKPLDTVVIRKCVEYAEMCDNEDDEDVMVVEESSDESEVWDCETIVSTYSNLDNHPGKIQAPMNPKKRIPKILFGDSTVKNNVIMLRGKEKLPMEFLPHTGRSNETVKVKAISTVDNHTRKPHGEESKEEKKERKAAVKEERREARRAKKELKGLYKCETQKAHKVAAVSGPSSIHIM